MNVRGDFLKTPHSTNTTALLRLIFQKSFFPNLILYTSLLEMGLSELSEKSLSNIKKRMKLKGLQMLILLFVIDL